MTAEELFDFALAIKATMPCMLNPWYPDKTEDVSYALPRSCWNAYGSTEIARRGGIPLCPTCDARYTLINKKAKEQADAN